MKAAILISGYLRSYENIINFINEEIKLSFDSYDVFFHITKNENKEDKYFNLIDDENELKKIISLVNPKTVVIEKNEIYSNNTNINSTINQWAKLYRLNQIKQSYEKLENIKYDIVIRLRPDINIKRKNIFKKKINENILYIPEDSKIDRTKLTNVDDGYICDSFAFGSSLIMDKYFSVYENINEKIDRYGHVSETILFNHIKNSKINYEMINIDYGFVLSKCNVFAICGDSGSGKSTLSNLLKTYFTNSFTLECDRYHKWERGNDNWSKITHLNPKANYIEKMKEDVFNLKIGKEIYQVDYDHKTGKFTEKQHIEPSNNLIVCGLHAIYDEKINSSYDIKIFMDPQKELKYKWKIIRDVKERGYSLDKVMKSIKSREDDYEKYILPQKDNADLIISFFSKKFVDIFDMSINDDISLKIKINKNINLDKIKKILIKNRVDFSFSDDDNYKEFIFNDYVELHSPLNKEKNFYDYITLFIFNI
jgi:uridine kinase